MVELDPITYEVIRSQLDGIVREMQVSIYRTSYSTLIRETHDMSCGLVDRQGNVVAQYAGIPIHLGSYPACIEGLLDFYSYDEIEDGDSFFVNHPYYSGCAHSLDSAVITPVFHAGELVAFCISISHKGDIGGLSPGSRSIEARDVFGEGLLVPPVKFMSRRRVVPETENLIRANSRTPEPLLGDYRSQAGPEWSVGARRVKELMEKHGKDTVLAVFDLVGVKTEQRLRAEIAKWKDGVYEAESFLDNDLVDLDKPVRLHVAATKKGNSLLLDFSASADQNRGPLNIRPPIISGSCMFAILALIDDPPPNNHGVSRVIRYKFRPGSVLDPIYPAPVAYYSTIRPILEDMILNALAKAAGHPAHPEHGPGGLFTYGGIEADGRSFLHFEINQGGGAAFKGGDGWSGCGKGGSGPKIACAEIVETEFPVIMQQFKLVPDSGGAGQYRGGPGYIRDYLILRDGRFTGGSGRYMIPPMGVAGGNPGQSGCLTINPGTKQERRFRSPVSGLHVKRGDVVRLQTAGGGGLGHPKKREISRVISDLQNGYVSPKAAKEVYGLSDAVIRKALANSS